MIEIPVNLIKYLSVGMKYAVIFRRKEHFMTMFRIKVVFADMFSK